MSNQLRPMRRRLQRGFNIVTAIFLIVVLALLGVYIVSVSGLQQTGARLDLQGVRGYQAARAGIEWAAFMVLDPNNALNSATPGVCGITPVCPTSPTTLPALAGSLSSFTVTVMCSATSATEGNRDIRVFSITSTATTGTPGTTGYVNRELQATLSKCHDSTATSTWPRCACG